MLKQFIHMVLPDSLAAQPWNNRILLPETDFVCLRAVIKSGRRGNRSSGPGMS